MKAKRYVVEARWPSTRTESGWTTWRKYMVAESAEEAETVRKFIEQWYRGYEARVIDREAA